MKKNFLFFAAFIVSISLMSFTYSNLNKTGVEETLDNTEIKMDEFLGVDKVLEVEETILEDGTIDVSVKSLKNQKFVFSKFNALSSNTSNENFVCAPCKSLSFFQKGKIVILGTKKLCVSCFSTGTGPCDAPC